MNKVKLTPRQEEIIRKLLVKEKNPDFIIEGGLQLLLNKWKKFVEECEEGYSFTLGEYIITDLGARDTLEYLINSLGKAEFELSEEISKFLKPIDNRFKKLLIEKDKYLLGKFFENKYKNKKKYWWYWGIVKNAKGDLLEDLKLDIFEHYKRGGSIKR